MSLKNQPLIGSNIVARSTFDWRQMLIPAILILILAGLYVTFFRPQQEITYLTDPVRRGTLQRIVTATGEVGAKQLVNVGAQVSGQIEKLYVELGQTVKKGDLIAQIDSTTQKNDLDSKKSRLESYRAQLQSAKIALKVAKSQYNRAKKLIRSSAISKENLETIENNYAAAKAKITELESLITQTQIDVNTAEVNMGYTTITAPLDGTIVSVPTKEGQTVTAAQIIPTIVQIADLSQMEILMQISEGDVDKIKPGMKVTYTILSDSSQIYETTLQSLDPGLTTLTNGSYTGVVSSDEAIYYYGRLIVPNEDGKLRIGMTTQNNIMVESTENALIIPALTISEQAGKKYVYVLVNNTPERREITTGVTDSINVEVLSGLSEGEQVIISQMNSQEIDDQVNNTRMKRF